MEKWLSRCRANFIGKSVRVKGERVRNSGENLQDRGNGARDVPRIQPGSFHQFGDMFRYNNPIRIKR